MNSAERKMCPV